mgnify:CR=1 FL=1
MFEHSGAATISKIGLIKTIILSMVATPTYKDTSSRAQTNQNASFAIFLFNTVAILSHA